MNNNSNLEQGIISVISDTELELNIQPAASILNVFSRLSYKIWYALAEFVDNSTQSYISNINELSNCDGFEKLIVKIKYDSSKNTLRITDNAFGMEIEKFKNAILLDSKNSGQTGRNEFGMGLKTAASWFGNIWTVKSTQLGSENQYKATINIPELKNTGLNSIKIHKKTVDKSTHGTEILIEDVSKKITASRTIGKIRDLLSSMYRRDINNRNIEIWFNDEPISFEEYPILNNFRGKEWKKSLNFDVNFNGKKYNVTGFVAIMNPGSFPKAGFALFRHDRVVIGGIDANYKPSPIFGQAQSQISLKLFGELNMNDFPVNQAKDGFIWDDGLEDEFIASLKNNIQEYINIAAMSIKERANETQYSEENSEQLKKDVEKTIESMVNDETSINQISIDFASEQNSDTQEYIDSFLNNEIEEKTVGTNREYNIPINPINNLLIKVQWAIGNKDYWIEYSDNDDESIQVIININHPFFMPYSKDENFKKVLEKFVLAFVVAEKQSELNSTKDGYIHASSMKNNMNRYLSNMAED